MTYNIRVYDVIPLNAQSISPQVALLTFVAAANQGQPAVDVAAVTSDGSFAPKVSVPLRVLDQLSGGGAAPVGASKPFKRSMR